LRTAHQISTVKGNLSVAFQQQELPVLLQNTLIQVSLTKIQHGKVDIIKWIVVKNVFS
jgi:hypothetical protein